MSSFAREGREEEGDQKGEHASLVRLTRGNPFIFGQNKELRAKNRELGTVKKDTGGLSFRIICDLDRQTSIWKAWKRKYAA